jgi:hypothetical protein
MTISFALRPASRSDRIRWITRKGDPSGPAIVAGSQIMKPRSKRILAALLWLAIITLIVLNGLWEQSLWIGGVN